MKYKITQAKEGIKKPFNKDNARENTTMREDVTKTRED